MGTVDSTLEGQRAREIFVGIMDKLKHGTEAEQETARTEAVETMECLIWRIMRQYYPTYIKEYGADLAHEGILGVLKGLERYDPEKSMPSTWFFPYIQHEMQRYINSFVIQTTDHYSAILRRIEKAIKILDASGKPYGNVEISIQADVPLETVNRAMLERSRKDEICYDACTEAYLTHNTTNHHTETPEDLLIASETESALYDALDKCLTDEERLVVEYSFGLRDKGVLSNKAIAATLDIPIDKIKKLRTRAIRKLRTSSLRKTFIDHMTLEDQIVEDGEIPLIPISNREITALFEAVEIDF